MSAKISQLPARVTPDAADLFVVENVAADLNYHVRYDSLKAAVLDGLGTLATQNGTFSGTHSGTSSGTNTGDQPNTVAGGFTGLTSIPAGRLLIGNGASAVATDAQLTYDSTLNILTTGEFHVDKISDNGLGLTVQTANGVLNSSNLTLKSGDVSAANTYAGSVFLNGGSANGANSQGGSFTCAGGSANYGAGQGGAFFMYGGAASDIGGRGGDMYLHGGYGGTYPGSLYIQDSDGANTVIQVTGPSGQGELGFFGVLPITQPDVSLGLHQVLSNLGLRGFGSPNALALDYTNTATVGNVTLNKASGRVRLAAGASTLTLTNSLITVNSRILLTLAGNPGVAIGLYVVAGAGSCTINTTAAVVNQTPINFVVIN